MVTAKYIYCPEYIRDFLSVTKDVVVSGRVPFAVRLWSKYSEFYHFIH